jgi:hypothetical protein
MWLIFAKLLEGKDFYKTTSHRGKAPMPNLGGIRCNQNLSKYGRKL